MDGSARSFYDECLIPVDVDAVREDDVGYFVALFNNSLHLINFEYLFSLLLVSRELFLCVDFSVA